MNELTYDEKVQILNERIKHREEVLGKGLWMPYNYTNSGVRKLMQSVQSDQILPIMNPEPPLLGTGFETLYGEESSSFVKADRDYEVICKIPKFFDQPDHHYYLILKEVDRPYYTIEERISYAHTTESYGYRVNNSYFDSLKPGSVIHKDDVIKKSTSYDEFNNRQDGINLTTAYISTEKNKEDGFIISDEAAELLSSALFKKVVITINDNDIPLNIHGDSKIHKCIPDINEEIKNGVLFASRREKTEETLFAQSYNRLSEVMMSDEKYPLKGKVIDITVQCNNPEVLDQNAYYTQLKIYNEYTLRFAEAIISNMKNIIDNPTCECSDDLRSLYDRACMLMNGAQYIRDGKVFSNIILEITIVDVIPVQVGDKLANRYGGKGVVSEVRPLNMMPLLPNGERVHLIINPATVYNRENLGQLFELSLNSMGMQILDIVKQQFLDPDEALDMYCEFIEAISPDQGGYYRAAIDNMDYDDKCIFLDTVYDEGGINLSTLPMSDMMNLDILAGIYNKFKYLSQTEIYVPVKRSNGEIKFISARRKITVGKEYIWRLKQYAEEKFSAVSLSSTNLRNENIKNAAKKNYKVISNRTPIMFGEMETTNLEHISNEMQIALVLLLYSSSPEARKKAEELLTNTDPFNVDITLDEDSKNVKVEICDAYLLTIGLQLKFIKKLKEFKELVNFKDPCGKKQYYSKDKTLVRFHGEGNFKYDKSFFKYLEDNKQPRAAEFKLVRFNNLEGGSDDKSSTDIE